MGTKLSPPRLSRADIKRHAEAFLKKYHPSKTLPVPIEEIAELQIGLKINAIRGLKQEFDIDGFINSSCDTICIDEDVFTRFQTRSRYTMAHELGHMFLHKELYCQESFASIDEYMDYHDGISDEDNGWLEWQAHAFAAYILMPTDSLAQEMKKRMDEHGLAFPLSANILHIPLFEDLPDVFGVSPDALLRRMLGEKMIKASEIPF